MGNFHGRRHAPRVRGPGCGIILPSPSSTTSKSSEHAVQEGGMFHVPPFPGLGRALFRVPGLHRLRDFSHTIFCPEQLVRIWLLGHLHGHGGLRPLRRGAQPGKRLLRAPPGPPALRLCPGVAPGRCRGVHPGDPQSLQPPGVPERRALEGPARAHRHVLRRPLSLLLRLGDLHRPVVPHGAEGNSPTLHGGPGGGGGGGAADARRPLFGAPLRSAGTFVGPSGSPRPPDRSPEPSPKGGAGRCPPSGPGLRLRRLGGSPSRPVSLQGPRQRPQRGKQPRGAGNPHP